MRRTRRRTAPGRNVPGSRRRSGPQPEWDCIDREPTPGQTGVGDSFLNQVCTLDIEGKHVRVEAHFFRRPGQTVVDANGMYFPGQYESLTRWEAFDASLPGLL